MYMHILNATVKVCNQTTICHLASAELLSEESKTAHNTFHATIAVTRGPGAFTKLCAPFHHVGDSSVLD